MMLEIGFIKYSVGVVLDKKYKKMHLKMLNKTAFIVALMTLGNASAAIILENSGTVRMGTEYHSNIQFLPDVVKESTSTYLTNIVPEYRFTAQDETNRWFGNVGINLVDSSNENIMRNRQDPFGNVGWERILENGLINLDAKYRRESTRFSQFSDTGLLAQDGTSVNRTIRALWQYNISEKWDLTSEASYDETKFSGIAILNNFSTRNVGAELMYLLNETVNPYIKVVAHDYRATEAEGLAATVGGASSRIRYQDYLVGATVNMNPKFNFNVYTGMVQIDSSSDEWVGQIETVYTGERYGITGTLGRMVMPIGLNQLLVGDELRVNYNYLQSEVSRWGMGAALTQNDLGLDTQELSGFYDRDLTPNWIMNLALTARKIKFEGADANDDISLGIFFTYATTNLLQ